MNTSIRTYIRSVGFHWGLPMKLLLQPVQKDYYSCGHTQTLTHISLKDTWERILKITTWQVCHTWSLPYKTRFDCNCTYILLNAASKCTSHTRKLRCLRNMQTRLTFLFFPLLDEKKALRTRISQCIQLCKWYASLHNVFTGLNDAWFGTFRKIGIVTESSPLIADSV